MAKLRMTLSPELAGRLLRRGMPAAHLPERRVVAGFCRRHHIRKFSYFGSVVKGTLRPRSDIDVLVEFDPGRAPGLLRLVGMQSELSRMFRRRKADLRTLEDLSPYIRDKVAAESVVQYAR